MSEKKRQKSKNEEVGFFAFRRVLRNGLQNYWRNIGLSLATTFVTTLTLLAVSLILLVNFLLGIALRSVESKVDISVFFDPLASEDQIAVARAEITNIPGVTETRIVSREEALALFKEQHSDNPLISTSLDELQENPLQTTLVIYAQHPEDYASINEQLKGKVDGQIIDRVNYEDNQNTIERLSRISFWARTGGIFAGVALGLIAVLVVFNTVRLTIYSRREEVAIMKLVGATNGFVRGPFIVEGILYGLVASIVTVAALQPVLLWVSPKVESFFGTSSQVFDFIQGNLGLVIVGELAVGIALGVFSSYLAIHRYLRV
jgi:cell division transport system permease protein